jgi:hypothetical protein
MAALCNVSSWPARGSEELFTAKYTTMPCQGKLFFLALLSSCSCSNSFLLSKPGFQIGYIQGCSLSVLLISCLYCFRIHDTEDRKTYCSIMISALRLLIIDGRGKKCVYGALVGYWYSRKEPVPVPSCPLQIPCKFDWDRTRPSATKEQLLTTKSVRYNLRNW